MIDRKRFHELDSFGAFMLAINKRTHEPVLFLKTEVGALSVTMNAERATQLGLALIRATGEQWDFSRDFEAPVIHPKQEAREDESNGNDGNADPGVGDKCESGNGRGSTRGFEPPGGWSTWDRINGTAEKFAARESAGNEDASDGR